jgi:hypothetical protein
MAGAERAGWEGRMRCRMSARRAKLGWMLWASWGMFGTAFTLRGIAGEFELGLAAMLSAPFWLAFAAWPFLWLARRVRDRRYWAEGTKPVSHETPDGAALTLLTAEGRNGLRVPAEEIFSNVGDAEEALRGVRRNPPDPEAGLPFETFEPAELARWAAAFLKTKPNKKGELYALALWCDTLRRADAAKR